MGEEDAIRRVAERRVKLILLAFHSTPGVPRAGVSAFITTRRSCNGLTPTIIRSPRSVPCRAASYGLATSNSSFGPTSGMPTTPTCDAPDKLDLRKHRPVRHPRVPLGPYTPATRRRSQAASACAGKHRLTASNETASLGGCSRCPPLRKFFFEPDPIACEQDPRQCPVGAGQRPAGRELPFVHPGRTVRGAAGRRQSSTRSTPRLARSSRSRRRACTRVTASARKRAGLRQVVKHVGHHHRPHWPRSKGSRLRGQLVSDPGDMHASLR